MTPQYPPLHEIEATLLDTAAQLSLLAAISENELELGADAQLGVHAILRASALRLRALWAKLSPPLPGTETP